jgi:hypothetical protein
LTEYVWDPLSPAEVAAAFSPLGIDWWITGGVAIDLFVGHTTREHDDLDIAMLRRDLTALRGLLSNWDVCIAHDGALTVWRGGELTQEQHQFWVRRPGSEPWAFEILLEHTDAEEWFYRRDARVRRPIADIGLRTTVGEMPFLAPEVCLLYKSPRGLSIPRNDADFQAANPLLDDRQRSWLASAIETLDPSHPWITRLTQP